jgi:hypothetical protein
MTRTERHTVLDWAEQLDTQRRATTRGTSWAELDAAIHANLTHAPGSLADAGTESLCDQALLHTQPADLAAPDSGIPADSTLLLVAACGVAAAVLASWLLPAPWF